MKPSELWKSELASWALPDDILSQAPIPPWTHPVDLFAVSESQIGKRNPSDEIALAGLGADGSVVDVGSGGGRATFALLPELKHAIAVDHQSGMLESFAQTAAAAGISYETLLGDWPDVAPLTSSAEVVLCHHVFYNVQNLLPFISALSEKATRRVVVELPERHPMSDANDAWRHFWGIERPQQPTADLALQVVQEAGFEPQIQKFEDSPRQVVKPERAVELFRIRLCLTAERDAEIAEYLANRPTPSPRKLATIWWDI